jgi:hypothetical protein
VHLDLSMPVHSLHLLAACTTFQENPTLVSSLCAISSPVEVDHFRPFVNNINGAPLGITDGNITDLSSLAPEFGLVRLLRKIGVHNLRLSVARSALCNREDVRTLIANRPDPSLPGRDEIPIMNLTRSLQELAADRSTEGHPSPHSTASDPPPPASARRGETERKIAGKIIVALLGLNSKGQAKFLFRQRNVKSSSKRMTNCAMCVRQRWMRMRR